MALAFFVPAAYYNKLWETRLGAFQGPLFEEGLDGKMYSKRKKDLRLLYHMKAVFLAPDGATEKHG